MSVEHTALGAAEGPVATPVVFYHLCPSCLQKLPGQSSFQADLLKIAWEWITSLGAFLPGEQPFLLTEESRGTLPAESAHAAS